MASFNKVILLGNLTRDPEMRTTNGGVSICKLGLATTRVTRGSDGDGREETVFVDVDAYGKQAEVIGRYFTKGRPIFIEGRLRLDQWEASSGERRSKLCVVLENFQFVGGSRLEDEGNEASFSDTEATGASPAFKAEKAQTYAHPATDALDEDVPF
jgi:single-strand DNA-binding protein